MTREQLEHAIRASCEVADDTEVWVFGSQAILGQYPDAPENLRASIEVDVQPKNHPDKVHEVDGSLGELSPFHESFGFYVHGVLVTAASLPAGWQSRVVPVMDRARCVDFSRLQSARIRAYFPSYQGHAPRRRVVAGRGRAAVARESKT